MVELVDVYHEVEAEHVLYDLLAERPKKAWISHDGMPSLEAHRKFIHSRPFRLWLLIQHEGVFVGAIEANDRNEMGVAILKGYRGRGIGTAALKRFISLYAPLPPIPAVRNGRWLANIAATNDDAKVFFARNGFRELQETWALCPTAY